MFTVDLSVIPISVLE